MTLEHFWFSKKNTQGGSELEIPVVSSAWIYKGLVIRLVSLRACAINTVVLVVHGCAETPYLLGLPLIFSDSVEVVYWLQIRKLVLA